MDSVKKTVICFLPVSGNNLLRNECMNSLLGPGRPAGPGLRTTIMPRPRGRPQAAGGPAAAAVPVHWHSGS